MKEMFLMSVEAVAIEHRPFLYENIVKTLQY